MKKPILFFFLFLLGTLQAQNLAVQSFRVLENDLDARVHHPVKDQNGDLAALIKVNTTQSNFKFEVGSLGVVKTEQKTGEIWVYVPEKVQRLTISHSQLGVLRNYSFPIPIEKAKVYELVLVSGKVETIVKEAEIETQWIAINSTPSGANVFLNDRLVGKTPYSGQFPLGVYTYKVELLKYHTEAGRIELNEHNKALLNLTLRANYGSLKVNTSPENGMKVYLDNENTGKTTPAELSEITSGQHSIKIISDWYAPQSKNIVVEDGKTTTLDFKLEPEFAEISVKTTENAVIYINGTHKAIGVFKGRLLSGVYTLKLEADKHYPHEQQLFVEPGKNQEIDFTLIPKTGKLAITSSPFEAKIVLNGKAYGTTPYTIKELLIGNYTLELQLKGHKTLKKQITIQENKTLELNENLVAGSDEPKVQKKASVKKTADERRKNIVFATCIPHMFHTKPDYSFNNFNYGLKYLNVKKNGFFIDYSQTFNTRNSNYTYDIISKQIIENSTNERKAGTIIPESNIKSFEFNVGYVFRLHKNQYASLGLGYYQYEVRQALVVTDFNGDLTDQLILMPEHSANALSPSIGYYVGLKKMHFGYSLMSWTKQGWFISKFMVGYAF